MLVAENWKDYEVIDTGNGEKLERWGKYILRRPDSQIIWPLLNEDEKWLNADAHYHRSHTGGGSWEFRRKLPATWTIKYKDLSFYIEPTGFKHTGLFPEQAANWEWLMAKIRSSSKPVRVLNLFAYTGGATVAAASAGAEVCHVDASKGMVTRAKENLELSGLGNRLVRFIVDDVIKFVQREERRGKSYDAIIMDPPSYGRGPKGELWEIEKELYGLVEVCMKVLSTAPLFFLINSYTTGFTSETLKNIMIMTLGSKYGRNITHDEIGLPISKSGFNLPCGIFGRWEA